MFVANITAHKSPGLNRDGILALEHAENTENIVPEAYILYKYPLLITAQTDRMTNCSSVKQYPEVDARWRGVLHFS